MKSLYSAPLFFSVAKIYDFSEVFIVLQLVSESVKTKQAQNSLLSEKQALEKQLQQVSAVLESLKVRIEHGVQQVRI